MDFAQITIEYVPAKLCVESKSLKFYLASYRNERSFNEAVTNRILNDFVKACAPREVIVTAEFSARGIAGARVDRIARAAKCNKNWKWIRRSRATSPNAMRFRTLPFSRKCAFIPSRIFHLFGFRRRCFRTISNA